MNHEKETFGDKPDEFRPERHLNEDGTHKRPPPDTQNQGHYTFGFGTRFAKSHGRRASY